MKYLTEIPKHLLGCSIDPITLTGLAVGALAGGGAALAAGAGGGGGGTAPSPSPPPSAPAPIQQPTGQKPSAGNQTSSFVGSASVPQQQGYGSKTLLGQ